MSDDSERQPGAYPRRPLQPPQDQSFQPDPAGEPPGNNGVAPRRSTMGRQPEQPPRARLPLHHQELPTERPSLPSARESAQDQRERTERLRAMRQDFLTHSEKKITPQKPRNIFLAVLLSAGMLALCIAGAITFFVLKSSNTPLFSSGGQDVAAQFMDAMKQKDYASAYALCSPTVQKNTNGQDVSLSSTDFTTQATKADAAPGSGPISDYTQTGQKTTDSTHESYTFTVIRNGLKVPNVTLMVAKDADGWKVSNIDSALFSAPQPPTPIAQPTTQATP